MRCREARLRLADHSRKNSDLSADRELMDHLHQCHDCANDLLADKTLSKMFTAVSPNDTSGIIPLAQQKTRIESRVHRDGRKTGLMGLIKKGPINTLIRRPAMSFGTIAAVVVLAILAFVPFDYHHTTGYTITMEGVNEKLAGDIERICEMLHTMGLEDAEVDILSCDTTCNLTGARECDTTCKLLFVELKTQEEVDKVIAAFAQVHPVDLTTDVQPVRTSKSGTLLDRANETILQRPFDSN